MTRASPCLILIEHELGGNAVALPELSEKSLSGWFSKLPEDVKFAISEGTSAVAVPTGPALLIAAIQSSSVWSIPELVREHAVEVTSFGRSGRVRLMAWMATEAKDNPGPLFRRLVGENEDDSGEDGGSTSDAIGLLFLEDLQAIAKHVVGPRRAQDIVTPESLVTVVEAAQTLEHAMAFRAGGV